MSKSTPPAAPEILDKLVLLFVSNVGNEALRQAAAGLKVPPGQVDAVLKEIRRRVTVAADFDRDAEVGTAYTRLNDLYRRSLAVSDVKTALAAQRELNKLLALYRGDRPALPVAPGTAGEGSEAAAEIAEAREHLEGLALAKDGATLAELCRLAATRIMELEGNAPPR